MVALATREEVHFSGFLSFVNIRIVYLYPLNQWWLITPLCMMFLNEKQLSTRKRKSCMPYKKDFPVWRMWVSPKKDLRVEMWCVCIVKFNLIHVALCMFFFWMLNKINKINALICLLLLNLNIFSRINSLTPPP